MKYILSLIMLLSTSLYAQDSLQQVIEATKAPFNEYTNSIDSLQNKVTASATTIASHNPRHTLDSIQSSFNNVLDSLKKIAASPITSLHLKLKQLYHVRDTIGRKQRRKVNKKIDSVEHKLQLS